MKCSWNATSIRLACQNEATILVGEYALCPDHAGELAYRERLYERDDRAYALRHSADDWPDSNIESEG